MNKSKNEAKSSQFCLAAFEVISVCQRMSQTNAEPAPEAQETNTDDIRRVEIARSDAPIAHVTVYSDRAELSRAIKLEAEAGTQDIVLDGLPDSVQENSIRVAGGRGNATILEVSYKNVFRSSPTAVNNANAAELHASLKELQERQEAIRHELEALRKEEEVVENFVSNVQSLGQPKSGSEGEQLLSDKTATTFVELVKFYRDALNSIDDRREKLNEQQKGIINLLFVCLSVCLFVCFLD